MNYGTKFGIRACRYVHWRRRCLLYIILSHTLTILVFYCPLCFFFFLKLYILLFILGTAVFFRSRKFEPIPTPHRVAGYLARRSTGIGKIPFRVLSDPVFVVCVRRLVVTGRLGSDWWRGCYLGWWRSLKIASRWERRSMAMVFDNGRTVVFVPVHNIKHAPPGRRWWYPRSRRTVEFAISCTNPCRGGTSISLFFSCRPTLPIPQSQQQQQYNLY